jgi:hypothetical protein
MAQRYVEGLTTSLYEEGQRLRRHNAFPGMNGFSLQVLYVAPAKAVAGDVVYADGVTWNPGAGEGIYRYSLGGAWVLVG